MFLGYFSYSQALSTHDHSKFTTLCTEVCPADFTVARVSDPTLLFEFQAHKALPIENIFQTIYLPEQALRILLIGKVHFDRDPNFCTFPDLDYLAQRYLESGISFVESLGGEFALCMFDYSKQRAYTVRDHVGTVPLSLIQCEDGVFFGSDTYVLARHLKGAHLLSSSFALSRFYSYDENYSVLPFAHVQRVMPGTYAHLENHTIAHTRYWHPERSAVNKKIRFEEAVEHLHMLLKSAIELRMDKNFTVGAHLSGGMDSGIVASMTRKLCHNQTHFCGFSWSPPYIQMAQQADKDERPLIDRIARETGIDVVYTPFDKEDFLRDLHDWKHPLDFPFERNAQANMAQRGVNLIMSGWGGDEFMGLRDTAYLRTLALGGNWTKFWRQRNQRSVKGGFVHILNNLITPRRRRPVFMYKTSRKLAPFLDGLDNRSRNANEMYRSPSHFMSGILQRYHLAARCEAWYNLGQEKGVEYRYPMIDRRIIEYCFQLDATLFAGEKLNKPLIRAIAAEYLPEEVVSGEQLLDPVLFQNLNAAQEAATASLREALPEMKQNPTLRFFRFDRLEEALLHLDADGLPDENTRYVLTYLAAAHAVTRGLNSPTS